MAVGSVILLLCLLSLTASNFCCVALVSFFLTTLPTKRTLFTFFDITLVLALTILVDISVRIIYFFLAVEKKCIQLALSFFQHSVIYSPL